MTYEYKTSGTCSRQISIELDGSKIKSVHFTGGCAGNTAGIERLVAGMDAREVIETLRGTRCGLKPTSCPDQLSIALEQALQREQHG